MLFNCLITFLGCIRTIWGALDSTHKHLTVYIMSFLLKTNLKFHAKYHILGNLSAWDMDAVLQWKISIAAWLFHILLYMDKKAYRSFSQHLQAPHGSHHVICAKNNFQNSWNISELRLLLCMRFCMWCCKERHTLLLNCLINFLRCIRRMQCTFDRYLQAPYGPHYVISIDT